MDENLYIDLLEKEVKRLKRQIKELKLIQPTPKKSKLPVSAKESVEVTDILNDIEQGQGQPFDFENMTEDEKMRLDTIAQEGQQDDGN